MVMPDYRHHTQVSGNLLLELIALTDVDITEAAITELEQLPVSQCWTTTQVVDMLLDARGIRLAETARDTAATAPIDVVDVAALKEALR